MFIQMPEVDTANALLSPPPYNIRGGGASR